MKVNVHSCSYKAHTFEPNYQPNGLQVRIEEIDTETNALFAGCKSLQSIADKYESFWNELNRAPTAIVRVVGIEIVRTNHAIKDWGKPKKKKVKKIKRIGEIEDTPEHQRAIEGAAANLGCEHLIKGRRNERLSASDAAQSLWEGLTTDEAPEDLTEKTIVDEFNDALARHAE